MGETATPASLREIIRRHGLDAQRRLGQHFLLDPGILARIVKAAGPIEGETVLEVGPGPGGLTRAILAAGAGRVVAIEKDRRCVRALEELAGAAGGRLEIVPGDARAFDPGSIAGAGPVHVIANLPYNGGTELLIGWLGRLDCLARLTLMFQKEVALRLTAVPGGGDWGRLAVLAQTLCRVERLFDLPPAAFAPPPRVSSTLVRLTPLPDRPDAARLRQLSTVTQAAFGQRRKMLRSSLRSLGGEATELLAVAGIDPRRRPETLSLDEVMRLAVAYGAGSSRE
jgi:16S rRNA (adenine1518-N6/adenine1519-N6)-dimethyltransferase